MSDEKIDSGRRWQEDEEIESVRRRWQEGASHVPPKARAIADITFLLRVVASQAHELRKVKEGGITFFPRTWHDSHDCAGGGACRCGGAGGDFTCTVCNGTGGAIAGAK